MFIYFLKREKILNGNQTASDQIWSTSMPNVFRLTVGNNQIASICLTLLTLETYHLCFIASKLLTVADQAAILIPAYRGCHRSS